MTRCYYYNGLCVTVECSPDGTSNTVIIADVTGCESEEVFTFETTAVDVMCRAMERRGSIIA